MVETLTSSAKLSWASGQQRGCGTAGDAFPSWGLSGPQMEATGGLSKVIPPSRLKTPSPVGRLFIQMGLFPSVNARQKASCRVPGAVVLASAVGDGAQGGLPWGWAGAEGKLEDTGCEVTRPRGDTGCEVTRLWSNEAVRWHRLRGDTGCEATQAVRRLGPWGDAGCEAIQAVRWRALRWLGLWGDAGCEATRAGKRHRPWGGWGSEAIWARRFLRLWGNEGSEVTPTVRWCRLWGNTGSEATPVVWWRRLWGDFSCLSLWGDSDYSTMLALESKA